MIGINSQIADAAAAAAATSASASPSRSTPPSRCCRSSRRAARVQRAYLGITSLTIDGSLAGLNLPVKSGALVQSVQPGSPAAKAGIHGGRRSADARRLERRSSAATSSSKIDGKPIADDRKTSISRHRGQEAGRHGHGRATLRNGNGATNDRDGHARAQRPGRRLRPAVAERRAAASAYDGGDGPAREDLRHHQPRRRRAARPSWAPGRSG